MPSNLRRPARIALLVLVVVVLGTASACGSDASSSSTTTSAPAASSGGELAGTWTLTSYTADGTESTATEPAATLAIAADGTFAGTACNSFSGTWTDQSGTVALELGPMTMMACAEPERQAQETAITTGFPKVDAATVTGDTLELTGDGVSLTFTR